MMNILNKLKLFTVNLFHGLSKADNVIIGQAEENDDKTIPLHQVKDTQRVANHLLKGEVTQGVKELRYRDYLVSEKSRQYKVVCDEALKTNRISYIVNQFGGLNHEYSAGFTDDKEKYTLNFKYDDVPRFDLAKYCTQFFVDLTEKKVFLHFNLIPNRNISTSKAFINYIQSSLTTSKMGGDFSHLKRMWFVTYKISELQNYLKFIFTDLLLEKINNTPKEIILEYRVVKYEVDDLISKYRIEELDKKYQEKTPKHLPTEDIKENFITTCEICGKTILEAEATTNSMVCGKKCCNECVFVELANHKED